MGGRGAAVLACAAVLALSGFLWSCGSSGEAADPGGAYPSTAVYFSPYGGAAGAMVEAIGSARREVLVAAYVFTESPVCYALIEARARGVSVLVVVDNSSAGVPESAVPRLRSAGIDVRADASERIMHSKYLVIDEATTFTGSYNFTESAEWYNAENVVALRNQPATAAAYRGDFWRHWGHSVQY